MSDFDQVLTPFTFSINFLDVLFIILIRSSVPEFDFNQFLLFLLFPMTCNILELLESVGV